MKTAATTETIARQMLLDISVCGLAAYKAARLLLGKDIVDWEPESLWLAFETMGVDVPESTRVKVQAILTLYMMPSFYWDGVVFEKTALAFDGLIPNPETLEEATTAQLAWATVEASRAVQEHGDSPYIFQHEAAAYAAVVMHREGFILAPEQLAFAQEILDNMNSDHGLRDIVQKAWNAKDVDKFDETPRDVQLARLVAVELHVREMSRRLDSELAALRG